MTRLIQYRQVCHDLDSQLSPLETRHAALKRDLQNFLNEDDTSEDSTHDANNAMNAFVNTKTNIRELKCRRASLANHTREVVETINAICKSAIDEIMHCEQNAP